MKLFGLVVAGALMMWRGAGPVMAKETILKGKGVKATLQEGRLVDVEVGGKVIIQEFGTVYINKKGQSTTENPLEPYVLETKTVKEKGDKFIVSQGMMRRGNAFLGEFGRVWADRKDGSLELTLHPTYFEGYMKPDSERPWHMDVVATVAESVWAASLVEVDGTVVEANTLKDYPADVKKVLFPAGGDKYLCIEHLNMDSSFSVKKEGGTVQLWFSDQNAKTTFYIRTECPSARLSLKVEKRQSTRTSASAGK